MNVNPFSYLMNKISQKVSKSGDRMTGELEFYNLGDSIHINRAGNATYSGWLKFSNANGLCGMYGAHNNKKPYFYDGNDFTQIALTSDIDKGSVSVTSNGSKTFAQLFNELFALVDTSKIRKTAYIVYALDANRFNIYRFSEKSNTHHVFTYTTMTNEPKSNIWSIYLSSGSKYYYADGNSYGEASSNTVPNGRSFTLYY